MTATIQQNEIENFFNDYEARFNEALTDGSIDIDDTVNSFTSDFLEANATVVVVGKNDKKLRHRYVRDTHSTNKLAFEKCIF